MSPQATQRGADRLTRRWREEGVPLGFLAERKGRRLKRDGTARRFYSLSADEVQFPAQILLTCHGALRPTKCKHLQRAPARMTSFKVEILLWGVGTWRRKLPWEPLGKTKDSRRGRDRGRGRDGDRPGKLLG